MSSCHWCENLQEPHDAHVAKGYLDLVFEVSDAVQAQYRAEAQRDAALTLVDKHVGPLIVSNGGLGVRSIVEPLEIVTRRRRRICGLFNAEYPREWRAQERRWWREWQRDNAPALQKGIEV